MIRSALLLFLALLLAASPVAAKDGGDDGGGGDGGGHGGNGGDSNGGDSDDDEDSDRARSGVSSGAILPLSSILAGLETRYGGRMIDAELKERRGRMVYKLELITPAGRVLDVEVDAATARILRVND
jgi:hypothetical protein